MARLVKRAYTTKELADITHELIESERESYKLNNAFWSRAEKDASAIRKKYYQEVLVVLNARKNQQENQGQLFG